MRFECESDQSPRPASQQPELGIPNGNDICPVDADQNRDRASPPVAQRRTSAGVRHRFLSPARPNLPGGRIGCIPPREPVPARVAVVAATRPGCQNSVVRTPRPGDPACRQGRYRRQPSIANSGASSLSYAHSCTTIFVGDTQLQIAAEESQCWASAQRPHRAPLNCSTAVGQASRSWLQDLSHLHPPSASG
jgi:hypothetical protein